jgi:hypothetical protein
MRRDKSVHPENIYAILPFFDASLQGHFVNFVCFFAKDCDGRVTKAGGDGDRLIRICVCGAVFSFFFCTMKKIRLQNPLACVILNVTV